MSNDKAREGWQPGDRVVWKRTQRGGYGFIERIPGVVLRDTGKRASIRVATRSGETVERIVVSSNLTERSYDFAPLDTQ